MTDQTMKLKPLEIKTAWQFDPRNNQGQPAFVHVTTAMHGPRAVATPPPPAGGYSVTLHLAPTDWLVQIITTEGTLEWTMLNAHAASLLLEETDNG